MRILMVQQYLGRPEPPVMPVGLSFIAATVPEHEVEIVDLNVYDDPYAELKSRLERMRPDVLALSIRNVDSQQRTDLHYYYLEVPNTLRFIKQHAPQAKIVVGGAGFSMFARKIFERNPEIDFGVYMEGEEAFPKLLKNMDNPSSVPNLYYREADGAVRFTEARSMVDLAAIPRPRLDLVDFSRYRKDKWAIGVNTKRGCPYRCAYCNYFLLNGFKLRTRPASVIVDEIEELVNRHGMESFLFADGVFSSPFDHVKAICQEIVRRGIKVKWGAWCDVRDITPEFLDTVVEAGCNFVVISPDAYSPEGLKGLNKSFTQADIRRVIKLLGSRRDVGFGFSFFLTPPGETVGGYLSTVWYYLFTNLWLGLRRRGSGGVSWVRIEPETRILQDAIKDGIITAETDLLPGSLEELQKLFYINPRLRFFDPLSLMIGGALDFARKVVRALRGGPKKKRIN